ncbi:MAG TPA: thioredoxin family protein [Oleiagrimonas sp.]|nr:thioredoxin family protein [Oleiagrimonas sp.]
MGKTNTRLIAGMGTLLIVGAIITSSMFAAPVRAQSVPAKAPEFAGITHWINSKPLTMRELRGKVVLIDFWAYSCINCLRTFPHLTNWYEKYKDKGLVIVGVHSPEFEFGKHLANVKRAVERFHIHYPVAMDSRMATWRAWNNQFWPAEYLIDKQGNVVLHHFGEGRYLEMENAIRNQLGLPPLAEESETGGSDLAAIGSPEMYFGLAREQYMANPRGPSQQIYSYRAPDTLKLNQFALDGRWRMTAQYAQLVGSHGEIRLHFKAGKLHMVAASDKPVTLQITVDGKKQPPVTVHESRLYTLFDSDDYRDHIVTIDIPHPGFRAFTFTFG